MGDSALLLCLSQGHFSAAQYLLQQFDVSNTSTAASSSSSPKSAFSIPSALARSMSSSFLDLSNKYGDTALMICAEKGHYDLVNFLLRQQVNVNAGNTVSKQIASSFLAVLISLLVFHSMDILH